MEIHEREEVALLFDQFHNLLTQSQKQALELYLFEDLTIVEIAKITATTRQAAYDAIKKGVMKLKKISNQIT